jgi:hypothetical protein
MVAVRAWIADVEYVPTSENRSVWVGLTRESFHGTRLGYAFA